MSSITELRAVSDAVAPQRRQTRGISLSASSSCNGNRAFFFSRNRTSSSATPDRILYAVLPPEPTAIQRDDTPHFITFTTKSRWILPPAAREIVLASCVHDHRKNYELYVAVVMPDHANVILTPMIDEAAGEISCLVKILRTIKSASAHIINARLQHKGSVWQEESFDRVLRSSENLDSKIDYILQNPVRKGLAKSWKEYPWLWVRPQQPTAR